MMIKKINIRLQFTLFLAIEIQFVAIFFRTFDRRVGHQTRLCFSPLGLHCNSFLVHALFSILAIWPALFYLCLMNCSLISYQQYRFWGVVIHDGFLYQDFQTIQWSFVLYLKRKLARFRAKCRPSVLFNLYLSLTWQPVYPGALLWKFLCRYSPWISMNL